MVVGTWLRGLGGCGCSTPSTQPGCRVSVCSSSIADAWADIPSDFSQPAQKKKKNKKIERFVSVWFEICDRLGYKQQRCTKHTPIFHCLADVRQVDLCFLFPDISVLKNLFELKRPLSKCEECKNPLPLGLRQRAYCYWPVHVLGCRHHLLLWGKELPAITQQDCLFCWVRKYLFYQHVVLWCTARLKCYTSVLGFATETRV